MTFHAAYEPLRAIRTERWKYIRRFHDYDRPVLANCDDSATKDLLVEPAGASRSCPREQLYDLVLDPNEGRDLGRRPRARPVLAELRERLEDWMRETDDPLLDGPVEPPPGALVNARTSSPRRPGAGAEPAPARRPRERT